MAPRPSKRRAGFAWSRRSGPRAGAGGFGAARDRPDQPMRPVDPARVLDSVRRTATYHTFPACRWGTSAGSDRGVVWRQGAGDAAASRFRNGPS